MSVSVRKRLHLVWLAMRKPHLFRPAITLNSAMFKGENECDLTIKYTDGRQETVSYRIVATRLDNEEESPVAESRNKTKGILQ